MDNRLLFGQRLANTFLRDTSVRVSNVVGIKNIASVNTQEKHIYFNLDQIFDKKHPTFGQMMGYKGLLFHEMHHIKYTDKPKSFLNETFPVQCLYCWIEDGRIETLSVLDYEKLADYYTYSVNNYLLTNLDSDIISKADSIQSYILLYGRKIFLGNLELLKLLRTALLKRYGDKIVDRIEKDVDKVIATSDKEERWSIVKRLAKFLSLNLGCNVWANANNKGIIQNRDSDVNTIPPKEMSKPIPLESLKAIAKLSGKVKKQLVSMDCKLDLKNGAKLSKQLKGSLETQNEQLIDTHKSTLKNDLKTINTCGQFRMDTSYKPTAEMKVNATKLRKYLNKLNNEFKKGYVQRLRSGKVNIKRYMNRKNAADTRIFSKYRNDKLQQTKMLVNIFLDASGSMRNPITHQLGSPRRWDIALSACWVINEALTKDKNKIACYQFASWYSMFKGYDEAMAIPECGGANTSPEHALDASLPITTRYKKKHKFTKVVDIIITDGLFDNINNVDERLQKLNQAGHETIQINVCVDNPSSVAKHYIYCDNFDALTPALIKVFARLKKKYVKAVLR